MIKQIHFKNFKALRDTTLKLGPFSLLVGPNGSGKSTVLQALRAIRDPGSIRAEDVVSVGASTGPQIIVDWGPPLESAQTILAWSAGGGKQVNHYHPSLSDAQARLLQGLPSRIRTYSLDGNLLAQPVGLKPQQTLGPSGQDLAGVLDRLRDEAPERFDTLNNELSRWLPEFDRVLFDTPGPGQREIRLRLAKSQDSIRASEISHGTLFALAILTLAYETNAPAILGLEEPDRGIHPRLLRRIHDALYLLSYPNGAGTRQPVQVIVTTHSPFLLDLYRDHPEEIIIAAKSDGVVEFTRLADRPDMEEILGDAPLGDLWFSGVLGGVPQEQ